MAGITKCLGTDHPLCSRCLRRTAPETDGCGWITAPGSAGRYGAGVGIMWRGRRIKADSVHYLQAHDSTTFYFMAVLFRGINAIKNMPCGEIFPRGFPAKTPRLSL